MYCPLSPTAAAGPQMGRHPRPDAHAGKGGCATRARWRGLSGGAACVAAREPLSREAPIVQSGALRPPAANHFVARCALAGWLGGAMACCSACKHVNQGSLWSMRASTNQQSGLDAPPRREAGASRRQVGRNFGRLRTTLALLPDRPSSLPLHSVPQKAPFVRQKGFGRTARHTDDGASYNRVSGSDCHR